MLVLFAADEVTNGAVIIAVVASFTALIKSVSDTWNARKEREANTEKAVEVAELKTKVSMLEDHVGECNEDRKIAAEKFEKCEEGHAESSRRLDESERKVSLLEQRIATLQGAS